MDHIIRARNGDRDALEALLVRNHERIESVAKARLGALARPKMRASDLVQATFLDVLQALPQFRGNTDEEFVSWMARILENNVRDLARYQGAKKRKVEGHSGESSLPEDLPKPNQQSPSGDAKFADEIVLVSRAMSKIPERYRQALLSKLENEHHPEPEGADPRQKETSAARVLLFRARAALLVEMEKLRNRDEDQ